MHRLAQLLDARSCESVLAVPHEKLIKKCNNDRIRISTIYFYEFKIATAVECKVKISVSVDKTLR